MCTTIRPWKSPLWIIRSLEPQTRTPEDDRGDHVSHGRMLRSSKKLPVTVYLCKCKYLGLRHTEYIDSL